MWQNAKKPLCQRDPNPYNKSWTEDLYARLSFNVAAAIETSIQKQREDAYIRSVQFNDKLNEEREKMQARREKLKAKEGTIGKYHHGQPDFAEEVELALMLEDQQKQQEEYTADMRLKYPLSSLAEAAENGLAPYRFIRDLRSRLNDLVRTQLEEAAQQLPPHLRDEAHKGEGEGGVKRMAADRCTADGSHPKREEGGQGSPIVKREFTSENNETGQTHTKEGAPPLYRSTTQRVGSCVRENPIGAYIVPQSVPPKGAYAEALFALSHTTLPSSAEEARPPQPETDKTQAPVVEVVATPRVKRSRGPFKGNLFIQKVKKEKSVLLYLEEATENNLAQLRKQYRARRRVIRSQASAAALQRGKKDTKEKRQHTVSPEALNPAVAQALQTIRTAYRKRRRVFRSQKKQIAFYLRRIRRRDEPRKGKETATTASDTKEETTETALPLRKGRTLSAFEYGDLYNTMDKRREASIDVALQASSRPAPPPAQSNPRDAVFVDVSATGRWASFPLPPLSITDTDNSNNNNNNNYNNNNNNTNIMEVPPFVPQRGQDPEVEQYLWPTELEQRVRHVLFARVKNLQGIARHLPELRRNHRNHMPYEKPSGKRRRTTDGRMGDTLHKGLSCNYWRPLQICQRELRSAFPPQSEQQQQQQHTTEPYCDVDAEPSPPAPPEKSTSDVDVLVAALSRRVLPNGAPGGPTVEDGYANRFPKLPGEGEDVFLHIHRRGDFVAHEVLFSTTPSA